MFQSLLSLLLASSLSFASFGGESEATRFDDTTLLSVAKIPMQNEEFVEPAAMSADAILAIDLETQTILYEKNSVSRVPIASLTKLMTAYLILEENDPNAVVTVSNKASAATGSRMGLYGGEEILVKNLLYGLFIESGNDAALALAEFNAGSEAAFIEKMNLTAEMLGMGNTHFANTTGLDSNNAYSTARDLAILSTHLLQDESVREIVKNSKATVTSQSGTEHTLINTNILLGQLGIKGLKTGTTASAGECLIAIADGPAGHEVVSIVLGSENRFIDTKILLDWIYRAYVW